MSWFSSRTLQAMDPGMPENPNPGFPMNPGDPNFTGPNPGGPNFGGPDPNDQNNQMNPLVNPMGNPMENPMVNLGFNNPDGVNMHHPMMDPRSNPNPLLDTYGGPRNNPISNVPFAEIPGLPQITAHNDVGVEAVMASIFFNFILFCVFITAYECFSRLFPSIYDGRKRFVGNDRMAFQLPRSILPFGWVLPIAQISWSQVRKSGGLDAYMYLRYIRMCLHIVAVTGFWGLVVLFPAFSTGGGIGHGWYHLSMANIVQRSWRLWIPTIFMWFMTFFVFFIINEELKHYVDLRMDFLSKGDVCVNPSQKYSLQIENIPYELRSDKALYDYFNSLFPGKVHSAHVVMSIPDLQGLSSRRRTVNGRLEKSVAWQEATGKRATHVAGRKRIKCCGIESLPMCNFGGRATNGNPANDKKVQRGERVDSINYYTRELVDLNEKISRLLEEKKVLAQTGNETICASQWIARLIDSASDAAANALERRDDGLEIGFRNTAAFCGVSLFRLGFGFIFGGCLFLNQHLDVVVDSVVGNAMSSSGFVTFKDRFSATCAGRATLNIKSDILTTSVAPDPRDIVWDNAHISSLMIQGRELTANLILVLGVLFWSVPIALIQAFANVDLIAKIPGMEWVRAYDGGEFANFVNGYLPVVALLAIIGILPILFNWIATKYEYRKTRSDVQASILSRFFYYQMANIYITVTAASIWDSLADILNHPSNALLILGQSMPTVVGFFIALLFTKILAGLPIIMLRCDALVRMIFIKSCFREKYLTQREVDEVHRPQMLWYGWEYSSLLLVLTICFTYACISPIILPVGALFFMSALLVYKKQVLFVYTPFYESGGKMFPEVCSRTLIGLICGQITLIGYSLIRQGYYQPMALLPLPFLTFRMIAAFEGMYSEPSKQLTLECAMEIDRNSPIDIFDGHAYSQPVLEEPSITPQQYRREQAPSPLGSMMQHEGGRVGMIQLGKMV